MGLGTGEMDKDESAIAADSSSEDIVWLELEGESVEVGECQGDDVEIMRCERTMTSTINRRE